MNRTKKIKTGVGVKVDSRFYFILAPCLLILSCSIMATRPIQEMSDTSSAIKAAREVNADTLAPDLYRQANETFFKAKNEYKFKNFKLAKELAEKARQFAEQAEFDALRGGASRTSMTPSSEILTPKKEAYPYPTPTGTPASDVPENPVVEPPSGQPVPEPSPTPGSDSGTPSIAVPPPTPLFTPTPRKRL